MHAQVFLGDACAVLATLEDASVDAIVTDPPAGVSFMGKDWDGHKGGRDQWIAWLAGIMAEARRCVKPGGYALVWALPRTSHWTAMALEDAGWTIRDSVHHIQGAGFPKSKSCLKPAHETWWLAKAPGPLQPLQIDACRVATGGEVIARDFDAQQDSGYGYCRPTPARQGQWSNTAGRWPPNTLLSHHPECQPAGVRRVRGAGWRDSDGAGGQKITAGGVMGNRQSALPRPASGHHTDADGYESVDAWTCHPQCPIRVLDEQAGPRTSGAKALHHVRTTTKGRTTWGSGQGGGILQSPPEEYPASTGSASRYFPTFGPDPEDAVPFRYCSKASRAERDRGLDDLPLVRGGAEQYDSRWKEGTGDLRQPMTRNGHPTVKPTALMAWLCKLVTAPGGVVLDPFCGSGSTGVACVREGFGFIGIEAEAAYVEIARRRIAHEQEQHAGPLFAGVSTATTAAR